MIAGIKSSQEGKTYKQSPQKIYNLLHKVTRKIASNTNNYVKIIPKIRILKFLRACGLVRALQTNINTQESV